MIHAPADEVLERLWYVAEESRSVNAAGDLGVELADAALAELMAGGWVDNRSGYRLSQSGERRARGIVRRHRLAEVLFVQALGTNLHDAEISACEMEHVLSEP